MATVDAVSSSTQQNTADTVKKILGKDDFLKLLVTQLKYQDPLEPTDNKDFIAQMAQFSSLEQMTNMSSGFEKMAGAQESMLRESLVAQAVNMIGHTVSAVAPVDKVTGKIKTESNLYLEANNKSMLIQRLSQNTAVTITGKDGGMYEVQLANGTTGYVEETAVDVDKNPNLVGVVTGMKIVDGVPNLLVNGIEVPISYVEEVKLTVPAADNTGAT